MFHILFVLFFPRGAELCFRVLTAIIQERDMLAPEDVTFFLWMDSKLDSSFEISKSRFLRPSWPPLYNELKQNPRSEHSLNTGKVWI